MLAPSFSLSPSDGVRGRWRAAPLRRIIQAAGLVLYLWLFFYVSWPYAQAFSSHVFSDKEWLPVESFLWLDPLVGLSTALAARCWNVAVIGLIAVLALGLVLPRGFCGYLCPLGTLIDLFDSIVGRLLWKFHLRQKGPWVNLRFYLLAAVLAGSLFGVLLSGFVAAIPVLTRGLLFTGGMLQLGLLKNWSMTPPWTLAMLISLALFTGIFVLGLLGKRFWCRYLCPSGALMSLSGLWKLFRRKVNERCTRCGICLEACPFDAINPDFSTRALNCAFCRTCAGTCPSEAIRFTAISLSPADGERGRFSSNRNMTIKPVSRRAMLGSSLSGVLAAFSMRSSSQNPIRPPGSVPEPLFLDLCIRCGQCIKVCPGPVLQAAGLEYGWEALWTPVAWFEHAGCHQDCNFCTQICPTQAIRPLDLAAKRRARMGLAVLDPALCLPHRGERDCQLCYDECQAAGYQAIEMRSITLATGQVPEGAFSSSEMEEMGHIKAPFVKAELCVGCGLCEYRCHSANVSQRKLIARSAVVVAAKTT